MELRAALVLGVLVVSACVDDGKDRCRNTRDCLDGYTCWSDHHCRSGTEPSPENPQSSSSTMPSSSALSNSTSTITGSSSSNAPSSSGTSGTCESPMTECGGSCVTCPADATATACSGSLCVATACRGGQMVTDGACTFFRQFDTAGARNIIDDNFSAVLVGGKTTVAYSMEALGVRNVRLAISYPGETSPFQASDSLCIYGTSDEPCRFGAITACGPSGRGILYLDFDVDNPGVQRVGYAYAQNEVFTSRAVLTGDGFGPPLAVGCDPVATLNAVITQFGQLRYIGDQAPTYDVPLISSPRAAAILVRGETMPPLVIAADATGRTLVIDALWTMPTTEELTGAQMFPPSGVDVMMSMDQHIHVCTETSDASGTRLIHIEGNGGTWTPELVDAFPGEPGARCRLEEVATGEILMTHFDPRRHVVRLSRKRPAGSWGTDDVDPATEAMGGHDVVVDELNRPSVVFATADGRIRRAR